VSLELTGEYRVPLPKSYSFKELNWITECTTLCVQAVILAYWSVHVLLFLCNHYPKTQWCSLSWCPRLKLIFHSLCGVTVGSYFMFPSGGHCSFAIFPSSPFLAFFLSTLWQWKWMFAQLAFPLYRGCLGVCVELQERRKGQRGGRAASARNWKI
jgi:hypothetical protein